MRQLTTTTTKIAIIIIIMTTSSCMNLVRIVLSVEHHDHGEHTPPLRVVAELICSLDVLAHVDSQLGK